MEIPHKIGKEILNYNPICTYCPLVPKRDTFNATDGTPLLVFPRGLLGGHEGGHHHMDLSAMNQLVALAR